MEGGEGMTALEKEIDRLQIEINTLRQVTERYKNPKELLKTIKQNEQYLEWFKELNSYRKGEM